MSSRRWASAISPRPRPERSTRDAFSATSSSGFHSHWPCRRVAFPRHSPAGPKRTCHRSARRACQSVRSGGGLPQRKVVTVLQGAARRAARGTHIDTPTWATYHSRWSTESRERYAATTALEKARPWLLRLLSARCLSILKAVPPARASKTPFASCGMRGRTSDKRWPTSAATESLTPENLSHLQRLP